MKLSPYLNMQMPNSSNRLKQSVHNCLFVTSITHAFTPNLEIYTTLTSNLSSQPRGFIIFNVFNICYTVSKCSLTKTYTILYSLTLNTFPRLIKPFMTMCINFILILYPNFLTQFNINMNIRQKFTYSYAFLSLQTLKIPCTNP